MDHRYYQAMFRYTSHQEPNNVLVLSARNLKLNLWPREPKILLVDKINLKVGCVFLPACQTE